MITLVVLATLATESVVEFVMILLKSVTLSYIVTHERSYKRVTQSTSQYGDGDIETWKLPMKPSKLHP